MAHNIFRLLLQGGVGGGGTINGFSKRLSFTVDHSQVGGSTLSNFPVCIRETRVDLRSIANGGVCRTDGADIAFYSDAGLTTLLDFEIERFNPTTGELVAHVRVASLSASIDTVFFIGFGKAALTSTLANPHGVWDSNYKAVYNFADGVGGNPVITRADSTSNGNNLSNGAGAITQANGQLGTGLQVTNTTQVLFAGDAASLRPSAALTFEGWVKPPDYADYRAIGGKTNDASSPLRRNYALYVSQTTGYALFTFTQSAVSKSATGTSAISTSVFSHLAGTYDGTTVKVYVNGVLEGSASVSGAVDTSASDDLGIGCTDYGFAASFPLSGYVDGVRLSDVARSQGWLTAQYNNQKTSSTFYTVL